MLDRIFDYLEFDDLVKMTGAWRLFWYVATMESLYKKFELTSSSKTFSILYQEIDQDIAMPKGAVKKNMTSKTSDLNLVDRAISGNTVSR